MSFESEQFKNASNFRGNTRYIREISDSHGGVYKEYCRLGCDAIYSDKILPTFGGTYCFHLHCRRVNNTSKQQAACSAEELSRDLPAFDRK
jgi:hypothetical protein